MDFFTYIVWTASPEIFPGLSFEALGIDFSFLGNIRWYGLLFALGFIISQQIMYHIFEKEGKPQKDVDSLTIFMIVATILGARLGHVFFYEAGRYLQNPMDILKIWEGGLASHGGAIGILIAIHLYINYYIDIRIFPPRFVWKKKKRPQQSYLWVVDRVVLVTALVGCFIRFGNFMNSEIIGKPTESSIGVVFAKNIENAIELKSFVQEVSIEKSEISDMANPVDIHVAFSSQVNSDTLANMIVAQQIKPILYEPHISVGNYSYVNPAPDHLNVGKDMDLPVDIQQRKGQYTATITAPAKARHAAQLYESISCLILFFILLGLWRKKKGDLPEGQLFGIFLIYIFGLRFFYEFLKENQAPFENDIPLNMGQWLSIPLVLLGIFILVNISKFQPKKTSAST
ncbi:MAG TPA: prolipoprotein diacylglyceryl transferase [Cytophagales bacterium]|jgi:phosphatidylglycerol:prolipoprotein diacylglycerol transferase|nr:prolipoprotein diacylglyceryl transferase [Cytophagales bacterium]